MASTIDLFAAAEIAKVMRRAVATIGTLLERRDEMHTARAESRVVAPLTIGRVWRALRDWTLRVERVKRQPTTAL